MDKVGGEIQVPEIQGNPRRVSPRSEDDDIAMRG